MFPSHDPALTFSPTVLVGYELTDDSGAKKTTTVEAFVESKGTSHKYCQGYNLNGGIQSLSYHYSPYAWDYHVHETGVEERWTPVSSTPATSHLLLLRMFSAKGEAASNYDMECFVEMEFTVQFREANFNKYKVRDDTA